MRIRLATAWRAVESEADFSGAQFPDPCSGHRPAAQDTREASRFSLCFLNIKIAGQILASSSATLLSLIFSQCNGLRFSLHASPTVHILGTIVHNLGTHCASIHVLP